MRKFTFSLFSSASVLLLLLLLCADRSAADDSKYIVGRTGDNCVDTCFNAGLNCNPRIVTDNNKVFFARAGVQCKSYDAAPWWASDQPSYNTSNGVCIGWLDVPAAVTCAGRYPTTQRVCRCDQPKATLAPIGTALSQYIIGPEELPVFAYVLPTATGAAAKHQAQLNHFWVTPSGSPTESILWRVYVDGEQQPSLVFSPRFAAGSAFAQEAGDNTYSAGGWFSKKSTNSFNFNIPVPFGRSVRVTLTSKTVNVLYCIVRGRQNAPLVIPGLDLRSYVDAGTFSGKWKLTQHRVDAVFQPLDFVYLANVSALPLAPSGAGGGFVMALDLAFSSGNLNILEGCFHASAPGAPFPGTLLASGGEDFFSSSYYFDEGKFQFVGSGLVQSRKNATGGGAEMSMYKTFIREPFLFDAATGLSFYWRNGDTTDRSGIKCLNLRGTPNGSPTASHIQAYTWIYVSI